MQNLYEQNQFSSYYNQQTPSVTSVYAGHDIPTYSPISPQYSHKCEQAQNAEFGANKGAAQSFYTNTTQNSASAAPRASVNDAFYTGYQNYPTDVATGQKTPLANAQAATIKEAGAGVSHAIMPTNMPPAPASPFYTHSTIPKEMMGIGAAAQSAAAFSSYQPQQNQQIYPQIETQRQLQPQLQAQLQSPHAAMQDVGQNSSKSELQRAARELLQKITNNFPIAAALAQQAPPYPTLHALQSQHAALPFNQNASTSPQTPFAAPFSSQASPVSLSPFFQTTQNFPFSKHGHAQEQSPQTVMQAGFSTAQAKDGTTHNQPKNAQDVAIGTDSQNITQAQTAHNAIVAQSLVNSDTYWSTLSAANTEYLQSTPARKTLKSYLQERCNYLDGDEIEEILSLAKELETQAVEVFKAKGTHKTKLQEQNRQAIDKLNTQAANMNGTNPAQTTTFTRKQISKMSMDEFIAKQAQILAEYAKGTII